MKIDQSSERIMFKVLKLIVEAQRKSKNLFITPLERTKKNYSLPRERFLMNKILIQMPETSVLHF